MALRAEEAEAALIQSVCSRLRDDIAPELVDQCEAFVRQFYHWVPPEDLAERSTRDLYGAAMAVWGFARDRTPNSASVRAYNPGVGEHGWQATNTIVEVVTDDMPFLVDSVGMELSRRGYGIQLSIVPVIDVLRDADGRLAAVFPPGAGMTGALTESLMRFEVDRETEPEPLKALVDGIRRVLSDVRAAVEDWPMMRHRIHEIVAGFESAAPPLDQSEVDEVNAFLEWVDSGNFICQLSPRPQNVGCCARWEAGRSDRCPGGDRRAQSLRTDPTAGRFTRSQIAQIVDLAFSRFAERVPGLPSEPTVGSRQNVMLAALTLSLLEALEQDGIERRYAIELTGDVCRRFYRQWGHVTGRPRG